MTEFIRLMECHRLQERSLIGRQSSYECYGNTLVFNEKLYRKILRVVYGRSVRVCKRLAKLKCVNA